MKKVVAFIMICCILMVLCSCEVPQELLTLPPGNGSPEASPSVNGAPSEPLPTFTITIGGENPDCRGGVQWTYYMLENGTSVIVNDSQIHPLDREYKPFRTFAGRADLQFSEPPASFSVTAWPNVPEGQPRDDVEMIHIQTFGNSFSLMEGDYIYQVHVGWEYEGKEASGCRSFNAVYTSKNLKNTV